MPIFPATGGRTSAERPDSAALLDGGTDPWTPASEPVPWSAPPENPPGVPLAPGAGSLASIVDGTPDPVDRVAVVAQPDGREDTSSWHTGGAGFLTLLWPHGAPKDDRQGEEEIATDYVLRDTEPWTPTPDPAEYATWQPKKQGDGLPAVEEVAGRRPSCTDLGEVPVAPVEETKESEKDEEADEEEETPRSMSDLLKQDNSAWGGGNTKPSGVLE